MSCKRWRIIGQQFLFTRVFHNGFSSVVLSQQEREQGGGGCPHHEGGRNGGMELRVFLGPG